MHVFGISLQDLRVSDVRVEDPHLDRRTAKKAALAKGVVFRALRCGRDQSISDWKAKGRPSIPAIEMEGKHHGFSNAILEALRPVTEEDLKDPFIRVQVLEIGLDAATIHNTDDFAAILVGLEKAGLPLSNLVGKLQNAAHLIDDCLSLHKIAEVSSEVGDDVDEYDVLVTLAESEKALSLGALSEKLSDKMSDQRLLQVLSDLMRKGEVGHTNGVFFETRKTTP